MLSPQELYYSYSNNICFDSYIINGTSGIPTKTAYGTPYDLPRLIRFLRHLKYPCLEGAPFVDIEPSVNASGIKNTGSGKLGLPFKFLNRMDAEAFTEIQTTVDGGTAHAIRNACDISRACQIESTKSYGSWESRMATEYLQHFCGSSLPDCLLMLGPDLVSESTAQNLQIPGCSYTATDGNTISFNCIDNPQYGAAGAFFSCIKKPDETSAKCRSCVECDPLLPTSPCCSATTCVDKLEICCGAPRTSRFDFKYLVPTDDLYFAGNITSGFRDEILKHIGIIKRKNYGAYGSFVDYSGSTFYGCRDEIFLNYFKGINNYDYDQDIPKSPSGGIDRCQTISLIGGDGDNRVSRVKDLLYNGYGVLLMTNVGFPNTRDSTGLSYPDRIWYHSLAIIGYDDTKIEFPECVYLVANSWGNWNSGGSPNWGPIPQGSFLITENHLKSITVFNHSPSFIKCKTKKCIDAIYKGLGLLPYSGLSLDSGKILAGADIASLMAAAGAISSNFPNVLLSSTFVDNSSPCNDPAISEQYKGCTDEGSCVPFECGKYQRAFGLLFGLSTVSGFPRQYLDYKPFYPINTYKKFNMGARYFNTGT